VPQITSIKQQKKKDRVNVYLDDKFGFGIDLDNFVLLRLRVGQELNEKQIEEIVKKSEFQKTLKKILRFGMVRPRSEKEYKDWLYRKKISEVMYSDLFSKLKSFELMDDEKFARWWIETRAEFSPKSKRVLEFELRKKGIEKEIIRKVLSENVIDEAKIAENLLKKKRTHWENLPKEKKSQKMVEYLVRNGFDFEIAKNASRDYNMKEDDKDS